MIGAAAATLAAHAGELPPEIDRVLTGHGIPATDVSIVVQAVDDTEPTLSHLADVPRSPASVMKTVTTWSALEYLGPAYTWPTEIYFLGAFDGRKLDVVRLPMPAPLFFEGRRLPASYANFYIADGVVIVPTFNDPKDRVALGTLAELFPGRAVVGIHCVDLVWGLGTLHCMTQQEPA